jgi:hypothetical protein
LSYEGSALDALCEELGLDEAFLQVHPAGMHRCLAFEIKSLSRGWIALARGKMPGSRAGQKLLGAQVMGFPPHHCSAEGTEEAPFSPVRGFPFLCDAQKALTFVVQCNKR